MYTSALVMHLFLVILLVTTVMIAFTEFYFGHLWALYCLFICISSDMWT